jgi:glycosyltransferase involved in cell wall biosynthesis
MEDTFITPELSFLLEAFHRVILVPSRVEGRRATVPDGIHVDETLAEALADTSAGELFGRGAISRLTWQELVERPTLIAQGRALRRLIGSSARSEIARRWLLDLVTSGPSLASYVAYSFWCNYIATGLALAKLSAPALVAVSRAHGIDLYPDRHEPPYLPSRTFTYRGLDALFPDSESGAGYIRRHYPEVASKTHVARMGVSDPGFIARASAPGRLSVVSCSLVVPVKRVDLIAEAVASAARTRPDIQFEWYHYGEGPLAASIESLATSILPPNVRARFPGYPGADALMHFYRTQPVDVFVNASSSEGTPVSVMEAISCGIPVVATAVGGNTEIVSDANGAVVPADASAEEIGNALLRVGGQGEEKARKRDGSRAVWSAKYHAVTNFREFADTLRRLRGVK